MLADQSTFGRTVGSFDWRTISLEGVDQGATGALAAIQDNPDGNVLAEVTLYSDQPATVRSGPATTGNTGANQQFNNMPPFLAINFIIALTGVFPSRN